MSRSTIKVFAATVYELAERGRRGEWVPDLIGPGDLPLSARSVRETLLNTGLVRDPPTVSSLREIANAEIVDPDYPERGVAPAARLATSTRRVGTTATPEQRSGQRQHCLYTRSARGAEARRGATLPEILAAAFVPSTAFGPGDAEVVWARTVRPRQRPYRHRLTPRPW